MSSKGIYGERSRIIAVIVLAALCFCTGCVERKLTIVTEPPVPLLRLMTRKSAHRRLLWVSNGMAITAVRITKDGYQTLNTHQKLKRPLKDVVPIRPFGRYVHDKNR